MDANIDIKLTKVNESFLHVQTNPGIEKEIQEAFSFKVPGYKYMPKYRQGIWDGSVNLYNRKNGSFPLGLLDSLLEFGKESGYQVELQGFNNQKNNVTYEQIEKFGESLNIHAHGEKITLEPHQLDGIHYCIANKRALVVSPTSSGKSAIIYTICRILQKKKILIVVPTTALVEQMEGDFADYSEFDDSWDSIDQVHKIYSGKEKDSKKPIFISTWQSIFRKGRDWFAQFDVVISDECFAKNTRILTPDGYRYIQDIQAGDKVINYDEKTDSIKEDTVIRQHQNFPFEKMLRLTLENGKTIEVTGNHKFYTWNRGWVRADKLDFEDDIMELTTEY